MKKIIFTLLFVVGCGVNSAKITDVPKNNIKPQIQKYAASCRSNINGLDSCAEFSTADLNTYQNTVLALQSECQGSYMQWSNEACSKVGLFNHFCNFGSAQGYQTTEVYYGQPDPEFLEQDCESAGGTFN